MEKKWDYITWLHIAEDVDTRFDTSKYDLERPLPNKKKNKKVIWLMKDKFGGKIKTEFSGLRPKTWSYLTDGSDENKKAESTNTKKKLKLFRGNSTWKQNKPFTKI